ncbi:MAG: hydrogenobyrinic acid a,c-diamide synthase (glutamine-hydrolyzing) [Thiomargarita sp.]|nr:hydrogenobyrinic acid a,c-diamide synthase (glutamine-hydrolyzing) [Thiomargarita sp.]
MSHLLISAIHKSSGKTTITIGLCASFAARGLIVQPFKKGPDYIDPLWLGQAAQQPCYNLDFYMMSKNEIKHIVADYSKNADISIIEGNKGLYDGMDLEGSNSNAALAILLGTPVILVLDTQGMTRGVAPIILGHQEFNQEIYIAGVILNQVASERHENKLRATIEYYTNVPVIGSIRRNSDLVIKERHLGLMPSNEDGQAQNKIQTIQQIISEQVEIEQLLSIADEAKQFLVAKSEKNKTNITISLESHIKIGIIRDAAFGFYYHRDLEALEAIGVELVFINALDDSNLPKINGLFIGGGFPEEKMELLSQNQSLKTDIYNAIELGMPVYAECGGLMYLSRQLTWKDKTCDMVGTFPFDIIVETKPQGRGYIHLRETGNGLWPLLDDSEELASFYAHEFHYSKVVNIPNNLNYAYQVLRGYGLDGQHDGVVYKNTLANYAHLQDVNGNHWIKRFVNFVKQVDYRHLS